MVGTRLVMLRAKYGFHGCGVLIENCGMFNHRSYNYTRNRIGNFSRERMLQLILNNSMRVWQLNFAGSYY